ncbi:hypothetical protein PUN28_008118 [Cardiocondyla obscurior]|uniref:Uncharacterized protein n=1 Tax=Cardiocondyla obscurior TaxID=286306 RepID=A0AAW2G279_9HYME
MGSVTSIAVSLACHSIEPFMELGTTLYSRTQKYFADSDVYLGLSILIKKKKKINTHLITLYHTFNAPTMQNSEAYRNGKSILSDVEGRERGEGKKVGGGEGGRDHRLRIPDGKSHQYFPINIRLPAIYAKNCPSATHHACPSLYENYMRRGTRTILTRNRETGVVAAHENINDENSINQNSLIDDLNRRTP